VAPVEAGPLEPYLHETPRLIRFGESGDVDALERSIEGGHTDALIATSAGEQRFRFPFTEAYNLTNALAAIAVGVAIGASPAEMSSRAADVGFSRLRGERVELGDGIVLVNDCYNANPVSMRAALDHLGSLPTDGRRIAVLGEMRELGPESPRYHLEVGEHARGAGADVVIGVGEAARDYVPDELVADPIEAAELLSEQLGPGDTVLVKGSRAAGLEAVAEALPELLEAEETEA
jgi:UDP-N-acetylmuramoyl-tripeptide--D-alanyl-D-alanine ligase